MNISIVAINSRFSHSSLALYYLKNQYLSDFSLPHEKLGFFSHEFTISTPKSEIMYSILKDDPDIIYFSVYIWNVELVENLIQNIKKIRPSIKIVLGGPEITYSSKGYRSGELENSLFRHADSIIKGDSEHIFTKSIKDFLNGELREEYDYSQFHADWDFPYNDLSDLENRKIYYETSRGCPYNCAYCLSSATKGVKFAPLERVKHELDFFLQKRPMQVKFVDRSFNASPNRAYSIFEYLIEHDNGFTNFHFEIVAQLLDDATLMLLEKARKGLFQFEIGIQTTNLEVGAKINRRLDFERFKHKISKLIADGKIHIHVDLIAGLPGEDIQSFQKSFNDVYSLGADDLQLGFLKLLKGTALHNQRELLGYEYDEKPPFEILKSKEMSYFDLRLLKSVEHVLELYQNSGKFKNSLGFLIPHFKDAFTFFAELGQFFEKKNLLSHGIKFEKLFDLLYEFFQRTHGESDTKTLFEYLKTDFIASKHSAFPVLFKQNKGV